ncbi:MAG: apolipoprotein N-acyltransferase [Proteobacteria bacterium]|nr:apolipoprotein N-acyltransferase [Pseudomonadota bacterium]
MHTTTQKQFLLKATTCFSSGALLPLAFSPYHYSVIAILSLAYLFYTVLNSTPRDAGLFGYAFGFGMFGIGVNWLHISINLFGGVNLAGALIITFVLVTFLSLYPALVTYVYQRYFGNKGIVPFLIVMPALWILAEWFRSSVFTGFPWLNVGYSQIDTPLSSLAPMLGVYGISWLTALISATLVALFQVTHKTRIVIICTFFITWGALNLLNGINWTTEKGNEISVALIQGAIPQEIKWKPDQSQRTLDLYLSLSEQYKDSQLIIWPETAIPILHHQAEEFIQQMADKARSQNHDYLVGIPFKDLDSNKFYNGIIVIGSNNDTYYKQHLVPFGEYLPFDKWLRPILNLMKIPMSDFSAGPNRKPVVLAANEIIGVSICYEDVFGEEIISALPDATLLVNISNDAWFGDSIAPHQHLQMARMRALETGRYMLRATNTGVSAIINEKGDITASSPQFIPHVTSGKVKTFEGLTPYARFGNWPVIAAAFLLLLITFFISKKLPKSDF